MADPVAEAVRQRARGAAGPVLKRDRTVLRFFGAWQVQLFLFRQLFFRGLVLFNLHSKNALVLLQLLGARAGGVRRPGELFSLLLL